MARYPGTESERRIEPARIHEESFGALGDWSHEGRTRN